MQRQITAVADESAHLTHTRVHILQCNHYALRHIKFQFRLPEQTEGIHDRRHAHSHDRDTQRPPGKLVPAVSYPGAWHDAAVRKLDGTEQPSRLRCCQRIDHDHNIGLRGLHGTFY